MASELRSVLAAVAALAALPAWGAVALPGLAAPAPRATGGIRGQVVALDPGPPPGRPRVSDLGGAPHDPVDRRRSVVYIEEVKRHAFDDLKPGRARLDQRGQQFIPRVLAITVGSIVDLPNNDTTFHNAFSLSPFKTFDVGRYPPGRTRSVRFDRAGPVPVFCDIHSHMSAYILVFSHPFFAVSETDGRYVIANVPAGGYTLRVWSELGQADPRRVVVGERETVEADFHVGRGGT